MLSALKHIRRIVAVVVAALFVLSLLGMVAPTDAPWLYGVERVQFVPALLGGTQR